MKSNIFKKHLSLAGKSLLVFAFAGVLLFSTTFIPKPHQVSADDISAEIEALQEQNRQNSEKVADLLETARSFEDAINQLRGEIGYLQAKIDDNVAKQEELKNKIKETEIELAKQRNFLGEYIKAMYVDDTMSTIEMLATSKDLSEFVDKEAYRNAAQRQVQDTLAKITKLKSELKSKKEQVDKLLQEQQAEQGKLQARRNEQQSLLNQNESQRDEFNQKTAANDARISELIAQQRAANQDFSGAIYFIRFPGPVNGFDPGGYPYKNAGFSMQLGPCSHYDSWPDAPDDWGYCTRQCVSYAAWAVGASGRDIPMYYGSAKYWLNAAARDGVPIYSTPQRGDIAITTRGTWGHAMYVEDVSGSQIYVSQYNASLDGNFSYAWRPWR